MKKLLWLIVCLMTMVTSISCMEDKLEKFNLDMSGLNKRDGFEMKMIEKSLEELENYFYLYGKYDLENVSFLKTKIHIQTDSLVLGESYVRGKNSFDGGTMSIKNFIYLKNDKGTYFSIVDDDIYRLVIRMGLENEHSDKIKILSKYVTKHGYLNGETDYEHDVRIVKNENNEKKLGKTTREIKSYKNFLDEKLGI